MPEIPEHLQQLIDRIDPEKDCVAVISPSTNTAFYIPDCFVDMACEGLQKGEVPAYVMAVMAFMHITKYAQSDPMLKDMMEKIKTQVFLDIHATERH